MGNAYYIIEKGLAIVFAYEYKAEEITIKFIGKNDRVRITLLN